ncbi:hypothetical protein [Stagnihabitans tardus]|uniref:Uncharacterized protein n=1 Tax=Stagnihabitans tardus TaxID=2699202 RepID=A0AAE4YDE4_9RHOB|nr:hypothetical protein [Stagnihabitans tardus]NBZ89411.1 hypothetical protein [Stagnihabitans tardus]
MTWAPVCAPGSQRLAEGCPIRDGHGCRVMGIEWHGITWFNGLSRPASGKTLQVPSRA